MSTTKTPEQKIEELTQQMGWEPHSMQILMQRFIEENALSTQLLGFLKDHAHSEMDTGEVREFEVETTFTFNSLFTVLAKNWTQAEEIIRNNVSAKPIEIICEKEGVSWKYQVNPEIKIDAKIPF